MLNSSPFAAAAKKVLSLLDRESSRRSTPLAACLLVKESQNFKRNKFDLLWLRFARAFSRISRNLLIKFEHLSWFGIVSLYNLGLQTISSLVLKLLMIHF